MSRVLGPDILLSILSRFDEIKGRKRFQKIAFLLKENKGVQLSYRFIPYLYGPYSKEMQMDLSFLCSRGLVEEENHDIYYSYKLTKEGAEFLKKRKIPRDTTSRIKSSCKELGKLSTEQLVAMAHEVQNSR